MTGSLVNEKLEKKILTTLYRKRKYGKPVILNELWKKNIENSTEFRITLQHLFSDKEYIWSERHRDIGNTNADGIKYTLDNTTVRARLTDAGVEYYRKEYRDEIWKYWGLRLTVISVVVSAVLWTAAKIIDYRTGTESKETTTPIIKLDTLRPVNKNTK